MIRETRNWTYILFRDHVNCELAIKQAANRVKRDRASSIGNNISLSLLVKSISMLRLIQNENITAGY